MRKKINVEEVVAKNPQVNAKELQKSMQMLKELQKAGIVRRQTYSLETRDSKSTLHFVTSEIC